MKTLLSIIVVIVAIQLNSCQKANTPISPALTGKWRLKGNYLSSGGPQYFVPAKNSSTYLDFNTNGTISGSAFPDYKFYNVKDSVTVTLSNADKSSYEDYRFQIKYNILTMSPAAPTVCFEGCSTVFTR